MHRLALVLLLFLAALAPAGHAAVKQDQYVLGLLWRGDAWTPERNARTDSLQAGHMANMVRRYEEGWLVGAGPVLDPSSSLRGLFIFKADSVAQVEPLVATDPAIAAGRLRIDLVRWSANAGIGDDYKRAKRENPSLPDSMVRYVLGLIDPVTPGSAATQAANKTIASLEKSKRAILSGSALDARGRRLVVLATADTAEARRWVSADPAVRERRLHVEFRPWMVGRGIIPGH